MENKIYVTKELVRKMYNELSEEIKKDEYNNTYAWFTWDPIILSSKIEEVLSFSQEYDIVTAWFISDWDEKEYDLDFLKENLKGIVDFEKWKKEEVDEYGTILQLDLKYLLENKIILDREKFLLLYMKSNGIRLLKNINLKNININQLIYLYYDLILEDSSYAKIIYVDNIKYDDVVRKFL